VSKVIVSHVDAPSPFVAFELEGMPAPVVVRKLEDVGIIARSLPGTALTRIAVGCWNDESDIDRLVTALGAL
jgi:selenocysteine lyase/cysteine desulfurase